MLSLVFFSDNALLLFVMNVKNCLNVVVMNGYNVFSIEYS